MATGAGAPPSCPSSWSGAREMSDTFWPPNVKKQSHKGVTNTQHTLCCCYYCLWYDVIIQYTIHHATYHEPAMLLLMQSVREGDLDRNTRKGNAWSSHQAEAARGRPPAPPEDRRMCCLPGPPMPTGPA